MALFTPMSALIHVAASTITLASSVLGSSGSSSPSPGDAAIPSAIVDPVSPSSRRSRRISSVARRSWPTVTWLSSVLLLSLPEVLFTRDDKCFDAALSTRISACTHFPRMLTRSVLDWRRSSTSAGDSWVPPIDADHEKSKSWSKPSFASPGPFTTAGCADSETRTFSFVHGAGTRTRNPMCRSASAPRSMNSTMSFVDKR